MNRLEIFQRVYGTDHVFTVQELERLQQVTELIVRECAKVLESGHHPMIDRFTAARYIKQHFKVEV